MKRKKLVLHRETLRALGKGSLVHAAGAGDTNEIETGCACTDGCGSDPCGSAGCSGPCGGSQDTCTCIIPASYCYC